jgi:hypothetical protein
VIYRVDHGDLVGDAQPGLLVQVASMPQDSGETDLGRWFACLAVGEDLVVEGLQELAGVCPVVDPHHPADPLLLLVPFCVDTDTDQVAERR